MSADVSAASVEGAVTGVSVCLLDQIEVEGGVVALVHGEAVAVFRTHDDRVFAIANYDPCSGASVLSRGIVGTRGGVPVVASPMHKQSYDLATGICLDAPVGTQLAVATYDVTVDSQGVVIVGDRRTSGTLDP